jgi:hypothetical protein
LFRRKNKAITETFTGFTAATLAEAAFAANVLSSEALDAAYLTSETAAAFADNASPALSINLAATTLAEIAFADNASKANADVLTHLHAEARFILTELNARFILTEVNAYFTATVATLAALGAAEVAFAANPAKTNAEVLTELHAEAHVILTEVNAVLNAGVRKDR